MDILNAFGLASRETESKLKQILADLEENKSDMQKIKEKMLDKIENSDELNNKDVKTLIELVNQLNKGIELYGRFTGDLKNQNINMNVSLDYKDAMFAHLGLVNQILTDKQKEQLLLLAKENGLLFVRDTGMKSGDVEILEVE